MACYTAGYSASMLFACRPPSRSWHAQSNHRGEQQLRNQRLQERHLCSACRPLALAQNSSRETDKSAHLEEAGAGSSEQFLDISELLRDNPEDFIYEEEDGAGVIWDHESRFVRKPPGGAIQAPVEIKGALDPSQTDILSAYSTEQGFREMTAEALADALRANPFVTVVDVRTPEEYDRGHIAGSSNISLDRLSEAVRSGELDSSKPLVAICAIGRRSAQACVRLRRVFGFGDVTNVRGGMNAWTDAGFPVQ